MVGLTEGPRNVPVFGDGPGLAPRGLPYPRAQVAIADFEDRLFAQQLAPCKIDRPVFITAIPRAGTTLLLECCANCRNSLPIAIATCRLFSFRACGTAFPPGFDRPASCRNAPTATGCSSILTAPRRWRRCCGRRSGAGTTAAIASCPGKMRRITPSSRFFSVVIYARSSFCDAERVAAAARYVSKNNLNIARTATLHRLFPDAVILVPFREPRQHAASLVGQHRNFLRIHEADPFASEYMRAIGHYDFGKNLRPVDFDGWFDRRESRETGDLTFWLEYWTVSYRRLLAEEGGFLRFVDYDALCEDPERGLRLVADAIGIRDGEALLSAASGIRAARPREVDTQAVSASLLQEVDRIYVRLREAALNPALRTA